MSSQAELSKAGVKVFQMNSRNENMMLNITEVDFPVRNRNIKIHLMQGFLYSYSK